MIKVQIPYDKFFLNGVLHEPVHSSANATLVICHGFRGSMDGGGRAVRLAEAAATLGLRVVRFAFTPAVTLTRQIAELTAVVQFAQQTMGGSIILLGRSMGGSAALYYASTSAAVAALALWATPWGLRETFRFALGHHYDALEQGQSVHLSDEYGETTITPDFVRDFDNYDLLDSARRLPDIPLLQVHGDQDEIVPLSQAYDIQLAAKHVSKKTLVVIRGGDHHLAEQAEEANSAVLDWLRTVI